MINPYVAHADSVGGSFDAVKRAILSSPGAALAAQATQTQDDILNLAD